MSDNWPLKTSEVLLDKHVPILSRIVAFCFILSGVFVMLCPWLFYGAESSLSSKILVTLLGSIFPISGLVALSLDPSYQIIFYRHRNSMSIITERFSGKEIKNYDADQIARVELAQNVHSDGYSIFQYQLLLKSGEKIPLSSTTVRTASRSKQECQEKIQWLSRLIADPQYQIEMPKKQSNTDKN